jgi:hypothetical protein
VEKLNNKKAMQNLKNYGTVTKIPKNNLTF